MYNYMLVRTLGLKDRPCGPQGGHIEVSQRLRARLLKPRLGLRQSVLSLFLALALAHGTMVLPALDLLNRVSE